MQQQLNATMISAPRSRGASHLECGWCGRTYPSEELQRLSACCERPLLARYDLNALQPHFKPEVLSEREPTLWRYAEVLPVRDPAFQLTLGEGYTPMIEAPRLGRELGVQRLWIKDEGQNPTGSFKALGPPPSSRACRIRGNRVYRKMRRVA